MLAKVTVKGNVCTLDTSIFFIVYKCNKGVSSCALIEFCSHLSSADSVFMSLSFSDMVCICQWLLRPDPVWTLVHWPVQCGKSVKSIFQRAHSACRSLTLDWVSAAPQIWSLSCRLSSTSWEPFPLFMTCCQLYIPSVSQTMSWI